MFDLNAALNECLYSDLYKDVYGSRPRNVFFASQAELDADVDFLCKKLDAQIEEQNLAQANNMVAFEARLAGIQSIVANTSREDAFRILLQSEGLDSDFDWYGTEVVEHNFNLPYGSLREEFKRQAA